MSDELKNVPPEDVLKEIQNRFRQSPPKKKVAIFCHSVPDPDAFGSMLALEWSFATRSKIQADCFYSGSISHPQNIAMVNLLDPNIQPVDKFNPENYDFFILVDSVPANAGTGDFSIKFDIVIDHHKENVEQDFDGIFINLKAGSCCATIFHLMEKSGIEFGSGANGDEERNHEAEARVATALLLGIATDTENLMSDDSTEYDFHAWAKLFDHRNPTLLKKLTNFDRPKFWVDIKADATRRATVEDGVAIVGVGAVPARHRDVIAELASEMVSWEDVHTAIVFALVDGTRIEGSVRSTNTSVAVPKLAKDLGGVYGMGGGKLGKGAYMYSLAGSSIGEEDEDNIKKQAWEFLNVKELGRIKHILKK